MVNTTTQYAEKFTHITDYIYKNLNDDLSVAYLSTLANFSKYHFHRQFSAYIGISVYKFIQLLRLKRASYLLVFNKSTTILDIALLTGFDNPESLSRAFKQTFNQTPSEFRNDPDWKYWHEQYEFVNHKGEDTISVDIVEFKKTSIAVIEHRGDPHLINVSIQQFIQWQKSTKSASIKNAAIYGLAYDDPESIVNNHFTYDLGCEVHTVSDCSTKSAMPNKKLPILITPNDHGVIAKQIPAGRCAVFRHFGSHDLMRIKIDTFYRKWMANSDERLRDFPLFFHFINVLPDVAESDLITDIYVPLQSHG